MVFWFLMYGFYWVPPVRFPKSETPLPHSDPPFRVHCVNVSNVSPSFHLRLRGVSTIWQTFISVRHFGAACVAYSISQGKSKLKSELESELEL